jgi:hypothetical protein
MILFVDGVDGSGKSTLIEGLLDRLAASGTPAVLAPPLWISLTPINQPEEFASWVQRTPGIEVARHLLAGMCRRVEKLKADVVHGIARAETLVVADRGPKTTVCSALAHAATGDGETQPGSTDGPSLSECIDTLAERIACLTASTGVAAVELIHGTQDLLLRRLAPLEELSPDYERYLRAFSDQMTTAIPWPGIRCLNLPADADLESNISSTLDWVQRIAA